MSASPVGYFPPTFFSPFYFPSFIAAGGGSGAPNSPYRDRDAFASMVTALTASGEFAGVLFGTTAAATVGGANVAPAAVITPDTWFETDDCDPVVIVRHVSFTLTLVARDEDPLARYQTLDRLTCISLNAIDGSDLGGVCLPALTRLRRGQFDTTSTSPEQSVVLHGEFTYLVPSFTGHNTYN